MENNGTGTLASRLLAGIDRKWSTVVAGMKKQVQTETAPPPPPSPEEIQERVISKWAADAPPEVIRWLDSLIRIAVSERQDSVDSHGKLAYLNGLEDAFNVVRARFVAWRGISR